MHIIQSIADAATITQDDKAALLQAVQGNPPSYTRYYVFGAIIMPFIPLASFVFVPLAWHLRKKARSAGKPTRP